MEQNDKFERTKTIEGNEISKNVKSPKIYNQLPINLANNNNRTNANKSNRPQNHITIKKLTNTSFSPKNLQNTYQNETKVLQRQRYNYFFNKFKNMKALQELQINDLRSNNKNTLLPSTEQQQNSQKKIYSSEGIVLADQLYNSNKLKNKIRQPKWHQEFKIFKQRINQENQTNINKSKEIQKKIYSYQKKRGSIGSTTYDTNFINNPNAQNKKKQNFYTNMNNISYFSERSNSSANNIDKSRNFANNNIVPQRTSQFNYSSFELKQKQPSPRKASPSNSSPRPPRHPNSNKSKKSQNQQGGSSIQSDSPEHWKKYRFQNQANSPQAYPASFLSPTSQSQSRPTTSSIQHRNSHITKLTVGAQYPSTYRKYQLAAQIAMRKKQQQIKRTLLQQDQIANKNISQQQALLQQYHKQSSPLHIGGERQTIHLRNQLRSPKYGQPQHNSDLYGSHASAMIHQEQIGQYFLSGMIGADITTTDISSKKQSLAQEISNFPPPPPPPPIAYNSNNSRKISDSLNTQLNSKKGSRKVSPFNGRNGSRSSLLIDKRKASQQQEDSSKNILPSNTSKGKRKGSYGVLMMCQNQGEVLQKRDISTARGGSRERGSVHQPIKSIENQIAIKKHQYKVMMKQGFNYKNDILTPGGVNLAEQSNEEDISGWG